MPSLDELHFAEILFDITTGNSDVHNKECLKHLWWHEMTYEDRDGGKIGKHICNAYDKNIRLQTQAIDFSRISDIS